MGEQIPHSTPLSPRNTASLIAYCGVDLFNHIASCQTKRAGCGLHGPIIPIYSKIWTPHQEKWWCVLGIQHFERKLFYLFIYCVCVHVLMWMLNFQGTFFFFFFQNHENLLRSYDSVQQSFSNSSILELEQVLLLTNSKIRSFPAEGKKSRLLGSLAFHACDTLRTPYSS